MSIIKDGSNETLFEADTLQYRKGMYELHYSQDKDSNKLIGIRNIHNQDPIVQPQLPNSYTVNGAVTTDIKALATTLSVVLGFKGVSGGITEETDPVYNASVAKNMTQGMLDYLMIAGFQNNFITTGSYNLVADKNVIMVTLKVGANTIQLPSVAVDPGKIIIIVNTSGNECTIKSTTDDGSIIWDGGTLSSSITLPNGSKTILLDNTENYVVII